MKQFLTGAIGSHAELTAQLVLELCVSDLAASVAFYERAGLTLERRTARFAVLQIEGRYLLLSEHGSVAAGANPPNLRIMVEDVDAIFERARREGWPIKYPLADHGYGLRDFTISDPDGYEVRFAALSGEA